MPEPIAARPQTSPSAPDRWGERLPRRLGLWSSVAVVIGATIGSGIFRTPAVVAGRVPELWLFVTGWVLGGVIALAGALTFAELAAMYPRSGGIYVYIRESFGRAPAFLFGWAELLIIRPAALGAVAIVSAEYFWRLIGRDGAALLLGPLSLAQGTAIVFIALVSAVNYGGVQLGAILQNVSTVLKVGALVALILLGFILSPTYPPPAQPVQSLLPASSALSAFGLALVSILWAYDGFADLGFISGEVRDPQRVLPRALLSGTAAVVAIYLSANAVYLHLVSLPRMPGSPLIAADAAQVILGPIGVLFVSAAVMVSTFGTLNASTMTGPRVFFAMAEDRLFFRKLAEVHPKFGTPGNCILLAGALGIIFVSVRGFAQLADQFIIGIWPFYALGVAGVFVLRRRRPDAERVYRTWGYPVVPVVFLIASLFLLGNYMISEPLIFGADVLVILAGLPVYWAWEKKARRATGEEGRGRREE
ncbi:MAG: amino acid permease [Gemmatimonadetes bacterium]|nr:amino acid permease [Gemmatimonadota bacterium]